MRLVEWADVLVENFAPRVVENWGLDRRAVLAINPGIVYMRMPGFGLDGPWRERGAFAQTQEQMTGLAWITGYPDDLPLIPRGIADPNAGMHGAFAVLVAMAQRDRTGAGVFVEAPMVEAAMNIAAQPVMEHSAYGFLMERMGNRSPRIAPQGLYACRGFERWLAVSVATDEQWRGLRDALGDPKWAQRPTRSTRSTAGSSTTTELDAELRDWAIEQDLDDAVVLLASATTSPPRPPSTRGSCRGTRTSWRAGCSRRSTTPSSGAIRRRGCRTGSPASTAGCTAPRRRSARTTTTCCRASSASPTTRSPSSRPPASSATAHRPLTPPRPRIGVKVRQ